MKKLFIILSLLFSITLTSVNAVEVSKEEKITGLYVAYFNRAADQEGLTYWTDKADEVAKQGGNVSSVFKKLSGGFATHPTFKSTYDHLNNKDFVSLVYQNALGRGGDSEGIDYWTKKLDNEGMIRPDMVSDFVELSLLTDLTPENYPNLTDAELAAAQLRQDLITNKVLIALSFTIQLDELSNVANNQDPERDPAYLASIEIISDVTEDISTLLDLWDFLDSIYESDDPISEILSRSNNIYEVKTVTITKDNLFAEHEGVKIAFSPFDIDGEEILTMQRMKPQPFGTDFGEMNTDYQIKIYDFTVKEKSERTAFIEVTIPYDTFFINNKSESDSIFAVYYNPDKKQYEPIDYTIDTEKNEIKIMTNHLSQYGIVKAKNAVRHDAFLITKEYTSKAKIIGIVPSHGYPSSEKAINIIKTFDGESGTSYDAFEAGFGTANFWLGLSAAGNTVTSTAYVSDFLQSLGNSFNAVGLGASIVQAGVDLQKGDISSLYSNFLKNYVYNGVNYFGTSALQLAFVGVFVIDLSLNHVITVTLNDNEKKYAKVYDACYNEFYNKSTIEWYSNFNISRKKSKNPVEMEKAIQKAIDDNVNEVWNAANILNLEKHTGKGTELLRGLLFVRNTITQAKKEELMTGKLIPVFNQMAKIIHKDNKDKYINELHKLQDKLNQDIDVQIKETIKEGETSKYAGYTFRFAPLNTEAKKSNWTETLHKDGSFRTHFTVLGHMQAGAPDRLEIYKPGDDPDSDKPVRTIDFKITPPNLVINIDEGGTCGDNGCDFSKLNTAKISFGINQTDFAYGPYTFTNPVTGETLTNQYDHDTGTFSAPDPWEDANFLTCSITQYNAGVFSSSCYSSEFKYNLSIVFALDSETEPTIFKTVKIHMTDEDGSSVYSNYKNIPLDLSGMEINDDGFVSILKDSIHGDVGSSTFCSYFQDLSGFYYMNYGDGTINKYELQSYDCGKGGEIFIEMSAK